MPGRRPGPGTESTLGIKDGIAATAPSSSGFKADRAPRHLPPRQHAAECPASVLAGFCVRSAAPAFVVPALAMMKRRVPGGATSAIMDARVSGFIRKSSSTGLPASTHGRARTPRGFRNEW
jgi:hypothetical protein